VSMPFTIDQFFDVFRRYNEAVWPLQWLLLALGVGAVMLAFNGSPRAARAVGGILAVLWLWMGVAYHLSFFRQVNPAASLFGALFILQGALLAWMGAWRGRHEFRVRRDMIGIGAGVLIFYALVLYPALGYLLGHRFPEAATFGLPCPTTILTFGILLWARPLPRVLFIVPLLWSVVATSAALQLGMLEDLGLPVAGLLVAFLLLPRLRALRPRHG